jgi:hypothetical protein
MENKSTQPTTVRGYKVTDANMQCRSHQFELNKEFIHKGKIEHCKSGFHFCINGAHCFGYYDFTKTNRVFEVEGYGEVITEGDKTVCSHIKFLRELTWEEVLLVANTGKDNTGVGNSGDRNSGNWNSGDSNSGNRNSGDSNSGYRNSGNWNSGDRNSGDRNSGDSNSGYRNSGDSNSGDRNSGDSNSGYRNSGNRNSGNWNSGDRNSGDSNSGYRNSGAFCTDPDPVLYLFNKPTKLSVKEWEEHKAVQLMNAIDPTMWVPDHAMTDQEKKDHPKYEAPEGYLKTIPIKEAWANAWHNFTDANKKVFTTLPNFDAKIFEEITGIKINDAKRTKTK